MLHVLKLPLLFETSTCHSARLDQLHTHGQFFYKDYTKQSSVNSCRCSNYDQSNYSNNNKIIEKFGIHVLDNDTTCMFAACCMYVTYM